MLTVDGHVPSLEEMRAELAVDGQVAVTNLPDKEHTLDFLAPVVELIRTVVVYDPGCRDASVLALATELSHLYIDDARLEAEVDLSATRLEDFRCVASEYVSSGLRMPTLRVLGLVGATAEHLGSVRGSLEYLDLEGFSEDAIPQALPVDRLSFLRVANGQSLDLTALASWPVLGHVELSRIDEVRGIGWVLNHPNVTFELDDCGAVEDMQQLRRCDRIVFQTRYPSDLGAGNASLE